MRVAVLSVALSLALFASPGWAQKAGTAAAQATADDPEANEAAVSKVPLEEIRRFVAVYNAVKQAYVDPVEDKKLMHAAVRGLLSDLDPHSTYFDKEDAEAFDEQATGAYDGIGVELLQQQDNTLKVIAPIDDTPAARAGIRAGDVIVAIDGKPIDASKAMEPLRGESGSKVVLTIVRDKTPKPFDVTLQRETIRVASVRDEAAGTGLRLYPHQHLPGRHRCRLPEEPQATAGRRQVARPGADLRSNPGGLLTAAVQVADDLLDKGNIVSTRGRISISDAKFDATPGDLLGGVPVIVLVDAGSASASEVLAGALRDNQRARIIGSRTFGKGSVQTVLPLDNGDSVKLTTARYYTPSGKSIQASGIVPEVLLTPEPQPGDADLPSSLTDYSEATLPGHLRGDAEGEEGYSAGDVLPGDGPIAAALAELKQPGSAAKAQAAQKAKAAKTAAEPKPAAARPATGDKPKPTDKPTEPAEKAKPAPPAEPTAPTEKPKPAEPVK